MGMGFTIGGSRSTKEFRSGSRRRGRTSECTAVAEYTGLWGWDVVPGARAAAPVRDCSCGHTNCSTPGAHPLPLAPTVPAGATLDEVITAAREGNVSALRSLEDAGLHLGWGVGSIVNLFNPAVIVIGGDLARAGDLLLDSARVGLRRHALDAVAATPVVASTLGSRASLIGAVLLAAERTDLLPAAE